MAVNLDFAETEVKLEPKRFIEREVRRKRAKREYKEIPITPTFHVITFDLSVKAQAPSVDPLERSES